MFQQINSGGGNVTDLGRIEKLVSNINSTGSKPIEPTPEPTTDITKEDIA